MAKIFEQTKKVTSIIWIASELALAVIIFSVLLSLLLGESSGTFVSSITQNCVILLQDIGPQSIIGITLVLFVYLYLLNKKSKS